MSRLAITLCAVLLIGSTVAQWNPANSGTYQAQTTTPTNSFPPFQMTSLVVDLHFVAGYNIVNSVHIAYHYCSSGPSVTQCALYDGIGANAKFFGVELIIPASTFNTLSSTEQALWHSHSFPIQAGILFHPEMSASDDLNAVQGSLTTFGKVINYYHPGSSLPLANAQAAYGITTQAQLNLIASTAQLMDKQCNMSNTYLQRAAARQNFNYPAPQQNQDSWHTTGTLPQYTTITYSVDQSTGNPS